MSLVHQALRKAEAEKQRHAPPPPAPVVAPLEPREPRRVPAATPAPARTTEPNSSRLLPTALIALAAVAIVALVFMATRVPPAAPAAVAPAETPRVTDVPPAALPAAPRPPPVPPAAERWKLTGISKDPAGNFLAIINGNLRGVNEFVDGAVIKHIERDRVTLEADGQQTVLRLF